MSKDKSNSMWGGHFDYGPSEIMEKINASIDFDKKLYNQDIKGSIAHATMLGRQNIITEAEKDQIIEGLKQVKKLLDNDEFEFSHALEDIHMNIEAKLNELIGDVSGKLHTARSRNDQVATDFKLYVRDHTDVVVKLLQDLVAELKAKASENIETIMPGFTHLQTAQPVTFAHHLNAYVEMISRDIERFQDARKRMNECPLGAAALAGTSFDIDRDFTASELGFDKPTANSLDSVSDRDFALEFLSASNILAIHLSRFAEEIVIWVTPQFGFVKLSDKYTTGSSIMPQKRNPDAAELIRAKTGRIFGALSTLSIVMKGLPLAYSKDMQEDKEPVFDAVENIILAIKASTGLVEDLQPNKENMLEASAKGYSTATDIADWLVKNLNIPFRKAHHVTGRCVKLAEARECRLDELTLGDYQTIEPNITQDIFNVLSVQNSVKSRTSFGGAGDY